MRQLALLALLSCLANAIQSCPVWPYNYPYNEYTWSNNYQPPSRPADSLLDNCVAIGLRNPELCSLIQDNRLTHSQKKQLITDDLIQQTNTPAFSEADLWNSRIGFSKYVPDGVQVGNSQNFKNTWIKIYSVSPLLLDETSSRLLVNDSGFAKIAYSLSFVVKNQSFPQDCRTDYSVCGYSYGVNAYLNGYRLTLQSKGFSFSIQDRTDGSRNDFFAVLNANSEYFIHHYSLETVCTGYGWYQYCTTSCQYNFTEDKRDSITVTDSKTAYFDKGVITANVFVDGYSDKVLDGWLNISKVAWNRINLESADGFLSLKRGTYGLSYDLPPYNVLTPSLGSMQESIQTRKFGVLSNDENGSIRIHFLSQTPSLDCKLSVYSNFVSQTIEKACVNQIQQPILNLSIANVSNSSFTAVAVFHNNVTALAFIGKSITFTYANLTIVNQTDSDGKATAKFNLVKGSKVVSADFITDFETKSAKTTALIQSNSPVSFNDIFYWICLLFAGYLGYSFIRRFYS